MNELSKIAVKNIRKRDAAASNEGSYGFVTGRRRSELDKAKAENGRNVSTVHGDVASLADLDKLYAQVKAEKPARPASTSRPIGIPPPVPQSKTACGCLSGCTILRIFANHILLNSFNNLSAQRASRFEP